jgi:hypothetical protein
MNLFRSEEHVARSHARQNSATAQTLPVGTLCALAHAWWGDRLSRDWRPHSREINQAILDRVGLSGPFWALP